MTDPLLGARLKVERARQHLKTLADETAAFVERKPYSLVSEFDPERGQDVVRVKVNHKIPARLGLIAADAAHNLRCALDHLVYQLAVIGSGPGAKTQFPIFDDRDEYGRQVHRLLTGVDKRHWARIEAVQPYHVKELLLSGGQLAGYHDPLVINLNLIVIARLDNMDKHRLVLAGNGLSPWRQPKFNGAKKVSGTFAGQFVRMDDGAELFTIGEVEPWTPNSQVKMEHEPTYGISFGDPNFAFDINTFWSSRDTISASRAELMIASENVLSVIDSFVAAFETNPSEAGHA